jgi:transposase
VARDAKVAEPFIIGTPETVRKWVRGAEVDAGARPSIATEEFAELKRLKRDNVELTQANASLRAALDRFAAELDRPQRPS